MIRTKKKLGDILVSAGRITNKDLIWALKKQATTGKRLGEILLEEGLVSEQDILSVLALQLGLKKVKLETLDIKEDALRRVPEAMAKKHCIIPTRIEGNNIYIAMSDPFNLIAVQDVKFVSGLNVIK